MGSDLKIFDKASRNNTMPHKVYMLKFTNQVHNQEVNIFTSLSNKKVLIKYWNIIFLLIDRKSVV